jgi:tetratricopeptide (TPR) repeat protein
MMVKKQRWPVLQAAYIALIVLFGNASRAQVLTQDIPSNRYIILIEEQFKQGHYATAVQTAMEYLSNRNSGDPKVYTEASADVDKARYYLALSALKTKMPGGKDSAINELRQTPNPAYLQRLGFALAQYYFQHGELTKAIPLFESSGTDNLDENELADEKFELAYCYFNSKQFNRAEPLLAAIKELKESKYYMSANYYYGLIEYNKNRYKEALISFDKVKDAKEYQSVVPYYIAEIYYFMGNRDKALQWAEAIINGKTKSYYDKELHLLAAQCLFETQKYKEAHPYFDYYYDHTDKIRKQDLYEMAYTDYKISGWNTAIEKFKLLNSASDSLGQTAMYLLGDCYLKAGDKPSARNAFGICADMTYNKGQQEAAMILYARISYETGYYDEALRQLNTLLKTFPHSQYNDEANTMISGLLVKTNHYEEALKRLDAVTRKEDDYWLVYQKANFGYAIQEFRKGDLASALKYFGQSLEHPVNADYESAAYFWKGEISYRKRNYKDAISFSEQFVRRKGNRAAVEKISPLATMQHACLNMGYASMELAEYSDAQDYFNQAQEEKGQDKYAGKVASVREADAVFMQKNYSKAIGLYEKVITSDTTNADYARYQKSILLGLLNKNNEKIALLQVLVNKKPPSAYANFARYEMALSYMEEDKNQQAMVYLRQLTDSISDKSFAPKSWMKRGFIYQQVNETDRAIDAYKRVVIDYPTSEDRLPALDAIKSLYVQSNQPAAYARLLHDNNLPSADSSSLDSTYYTAAEIQYAAGKPDVAITGFNNYLQQYPRGIFAIKAHYYRAESNFQLKNYNAAKEDYSIILSGPWNEFFENSARHAATIAYEDKDFAKAFEYYRKLAANTNNDQMRELAYQGLLKAGYNSGRYQDAALYADSLMMMPSVSAEKSNEALYFKGLSLQHFDSLDAAIRVYTQLSENKNGDIAAESRYHIAEILFKQEKLKDAEDAANKAIHLSSGYDFWIGKSYLLLSDILVKQKDYFNAKALLESIVKHTKIAELKQDAAKKLEEVKKLEKKQSKLSEE